MLTRWSRMALTLSSYSNWEHDTCWQRTGSRYPFPTAQIYLPPISCIMCVWCIGSLDESDMETRVLLRQMDESFQSEAIGGIVITHIYFSCYSLSETYSVRFSVTCTEISLVRPIVLEGQAHFLYPITIFIWLCTSFGSRCLWETWSRWFHHSAERSPFMSVILNKKRPGHL